MSLRTVDVVDQDFFDAYELASDGYLSYLSTTIISTTSGTKTIVINNPFDGIGILYSKDHPTQIGDIVFLNGTSGGLSDGYFTVASIIDDTSFTVVENIATTTGGNINFIYPSGASKIGFDSTGLTKTTANNLQLAIKDLDLSTVDYNEHETLRQLIHFIDEGPANGFISGSYKETTGLIFPTSIIWYVDNTKTQKIVEKTVVWTGVVPTTITWKVYSEDGVTVAHTVSDSISYTNNIFETSRTRTIS